MATSNEVSLASSCSTVRAPMMVEVTSGCCRTQASATAAIEAPSSSLIRRSRSKAAKVSSLRCRAACQVRPEPAGDAFPRVYSPVSTPLASGLHRVTPPEFARDAELFALHGAAQQGVFDLDGGHLRPAPQFRDGRHAGYRPGGGVRQPDATDLPGSDQVVRGRERLVQRGVPIPVVLPVQVDVVGAQAAQRALDLLHDRFAAGTAAVRVAGEHATRESGRDHQPVAQSSVLVLVRADGLLGAASVVDVGGVDEVAAGSEVAVQEGGGRLVVGAPVGVAEGQSPKVIGLTRRPERPSVRNEFNCMSVVPSVERPGARRVVGCASSDA